MIWTIEYVDNHKRVVFAALDPIYPFILTSETNMAVAACFTEYLFAQYKLAEMLRCIERNNLPLRPWKIVTYGKPNA